MAFLEKDDLKSVIREYQLDAITNNDDSIVLAGISRAIEEVMDIFTPNNQLQWIDGRPHYDTDAIFGAEDDDRNALMLGRVKTVALWHIIGLCNTGMDYTDVEKRYNNTISDLKALASGKTNSSKLPQLENAPPDDELPMSFGSRCKFNHEY